MESRASKRGDIGSSVEDHSLRDACIAVVVLVLLLSAFGGCGDEDFTVGGPLPTRPTVDATNPSATPDDGF